MAKTKIKKPWTDRDWTGPSVFRPIYKPSDGFAQIQQERCLLPKKKRESGRPVNRFCCHGHDKWLPHGTYLSSFRVVKNGKSYNLLARRCAVCRRAIMKKK